MKMKQFLFCAMAFIAALTFSTACMDDLSNQIVIPDGAQVIPFTVKAQKDLGTKATVDDEKNLIFEEGDFLKIEGTDIVGQLDLIAGANTTSGTFSGNIYYSGTAPFDENVMLTATLFGANDQTATDPSFSNAICASLADAVRKYSQLGATASYKEFKEHGIGLAMNTSYIDFTVIIDPAPASAQTATIYNNEGADVLCSGDVMFDAGVARFAAAFPAGTTLTKASLVVNGKDFHFGGASASLTAGSVYTVNKVYQADRFNPLTIKVVRLDNSLTAIPVENPRGMKYRKNGGALTDVPSTGIPVERGDEIQLFGNNASYGDGSATHIFGSDGWGRGDKARCYVYGNVMSLIDSENYATLTTLTADYTFMRLFGGRYAPIYDDPNHSLVLPATTLTKECYRGMFLGCSNMTEAPILPATTLAEGCYKEMFEGSWLYEAPMLPAKNLAPLCYNEMFVGCENLSSAPELPATTLAAGCYASMFSGCISLTQAPELPATTLAASCYSEMFMGCTGIGQAPVLPAETLVEGCYYRMLAGCSSLNYIDCRATSISATDCTKEWVAGVAPTGTFIQAASVTPAWRIESIHGIPIGWSELTPEMIPLSLQALEDGTIHVYNVRSNLSYTKNGADQGAVTSTISVAAGDVLQFFGDNAAYGDGDNPMYFFADNGNDPRCYIYGNVMSLISSTDFASLKELTAPYAFRDLFSARATPILNHPSQKLVLPATTLTTGCYSGMFENCPLLTEAPELPATVMADGCYYSMFEACTGLTTPPELPARTLAYNCYHEMFCGSGLTVAPELPATTLASGCYSGMFFSCTNLTEAPVLPAETLVDECYTGMFQNCQNLNYIKCLATNIGATDCTAEWVLRVAPSGTFVAASTVTPAWQIESIDGIPIGWTDLTPEETPLSLAAIEDGTIYIENVRSNLTYKINGVDQGPVTNSIDVEAGDIVQFFGDNATYGDGSPMQIFKDNDPDQPRCYIYGNVMSLISSTGFSTLKVLSASDTFKDLFGNDGTPILNHPNKKLVLPATTLTERCYSKMFQNCEMLTEAPALPALEMKEECYRSMFEECSALTTPPALPATTLADGCYSEMFLGSSLTVAPALQATTLAIACYSSMFMNCESLTEAPVLPASELKEACYYEMFSGCKNLNYIKCLATDITADECTKKWVQNVAPTGTFIAADGMTDWIPNSIDGIPIGWSTVDPLATPLTLEVFETGSGKIYIENVKSNLTYKKNNVDMGAVTSEINVEAGDIIQFYGNNAAYGTENGVNAMHIFRDDATQPKCYIYGNIMSLISSTGFASLTELTAPYAFSGLFRERATPIYNHSSKKLLLPATTLTGECYKSMFENCPYLTEAPELPATTLAEGCYWSMFENCTALAAAPELPATTLAEACYCEMFCGCTALTTAPELPATTLAEGCYSTMFMGCTNLTAAPELPAATLVVGCYNEMFRNCSSLSYIKCLATNISASYSRYKWVEGVASTGTFVAAPGMTSWPIDSVDGIPIGWSGGASLDTPLTLEVKSSSGSITINNVMQRSIQYSINGADRTPLRSDATITISGLHLGDCVQLFGTSPSNGWVSRDSEGHEQYFDDNYWHYTSIACDMDCYVYGNVMSLVDNTNFATNATLTGDFAFMGLFKDNSHIYSHSSKELLLPATSLTKGCYFAMFDNCPNFTEAPELPANAMADYSYMFMFSRTGLSTAPELPALTLSMGCYSAMFFGCANLTAAPVLPATTMAEICYYAMFVSTGLTAIPSLPATSLAAGCYGVMFSGCTGITSVPDNCLPVTTLAPACYGGMFQSTSLTKTPNLPATTLAESCYLSMFYGCNSLTEIKPLPATTLAKECYYTMFENCTALTSLPADCLPATIMAPSCYHGMFEGCTNLEHYYATELAAEQLAPSCFYSMFEGCIKLEEAPSFKSTITQMERFCCRDMYSGCSSLTTAPTLSATTMAEGCYSFMFRDCIELVNGPTVLPATTLAKECYSGMFWGCKKLEVSPILPAATLVESCYGSMFSGCSSLNRITCLATDKSADKCTWSWWTGVPSTGGTFVKSPLVDASFWAHDGYGSGAPMYWTIIDYSE